MNRSGWTRRTTSAKCPSCSSPCSVLNSLRSAGLIFACFTFPQLAGGDKQQRFVDPSGRICASAVRSSTSNCASTARKASSPLDSCRRSSSSAARCAATTACCRFARHYMSGMIRDRRREGLWSPIRIGASDAAQRPRWASLVSGIRQAAINSVFPL